MRHAVLAGAPIRISKRQDLKVSRGQVVSGRGTHVHAATFIRQRSIVLDADLFRSNAELQRIFIHELFHFVWVRLSNGQRRSFELLLEAQHKVAGDLGWSAEYRKQELEAQDVKSRSRRWREYCCEAFCDTAAYFYARSKRHDEFTLPLRQRKKRIQWFGKNLASGRVRI